MAQAILLRKAATCGKNIATMSQQVLDQMANYTWPGNVRELENVIERAIVLNDGEVLEALPSLAGPQPVSEEDDPLDVWLRQLPDAGIKSEKIVAAFERRLIEAALERNQHIKARAGRWLGFGDRAKDKMRYLCDKYDIETQDNTQ